MYFLQRRHSSPYYHPTQLLHPSFAYMLANPEERIKSDTRHEACSSGSAQSQRCRKSTTTVMESNYIHVVEETDRFLLFSDLPGIKLEDLKVELAAAPELEGVVVLRIEGKRRLQLRGGGVTAKVINRQFVVDDRLIDLSKITATLEDGMLQIDAPKIAEETNNNDKPWRVAVVAGAVPTTSTTDKAEESESVSYLSFQLDLPGVKVDALQVEVDHDGKLVIVGERHRQGGTATILRRVFSLDRRTVDTETVQAFLEDGVLTIRGPKKQPFVGRVIPVNKEAEPAETDTDSDTDSENAAASQDTTEEDKKDESSEDTTEEVVVVGKQEEEEEEEAKEGAAAEKVEEEKSVLDNNKLTDAHAPLSPSEDDKEEDSEFEMVVPETVADEDED